VTEERRGQAGCRARDHKIVIGADGNVVDVRVFRRLGDGLGSRAQAARQWRFSPARRFGTLVAVIIEVAVELTLR